MKKETVRRLIILALIQLILLVLAWKMLMDSGPGFMTIINFANNPIEAIKGYLICFGLILGIILFAIVCLRAIKENREQMNRIKRGLRK